MNGWLLLTWCFVGSGNVVCGLLGVIVVTYAC